MFRVTGTRTADSNRRSACAETDLRTWVEAANASAYRRNVLRKAHVERLLEYDETSRTVRLSPKGARYAEEHLPLVT